MLRILKNMTSHIFQHRGKRVAFFHPGYLASMDKSYGRERPPAFKT
ncbi:MAG: hypothetical protein H6577_06040 [Lewinellaceae bacterium]|nr:hypothetical protein [Saprospiraceae bacterium]MCB9337668.1 hypothetical protein [Lewinellaceae bacterium]